MGINRGKQFEKNIQEQLDEITDAVTIRLYDVTMGYSGVNNPCDFIIYRYPNILYLECKSKNDNTLNFKSDIRENQWEKLYNYSTTKGANAGIICWFIKQDKTVYLPIEYLHYLKEHGYKSFNIVKDINKIPLYEIEGTKKRIFYTYNLKKFLNEISS